jgi:hypothetical protein
MKDDVHVNAANAHTYYTRESVPFNQTPEFMSLNFY